MMTRPMSSRIVSPTEVTSGVAARILRISQETVTRLCEEGVLRARRVRATGWWMISFDSIVEHNARIRPPQ